MKLVKMNFKNYSFSINPTDIKLKHSKNVLVESVLDGIDKTKVVSIKPIIVIGSGILAGDNMLDEMKKLQIVFDDKGSDYLFLPGYAPIKAYFSNLNLKLSGDKNSISYDFEFVEDRGLKKDKYNFGYTIAKENENLFDIANRLNVDVELLVNKNDFSDLFAVKEGDKVYYA